jgi:hypothetical protein
VNYNHISGVMATVLASNVAVWIRWCNGYRARLNIGYIKGDIVNVVLLQLIEHQKSDLGIFSYDYVLYKKNDI